MNICFCIPARYESSRLPHKLLLTFNDKTCIEKTYLQVSKSKYFNNNIYLLTDSKKIENVMKPYNCNTILTTKECVNGTDRISKHLDYIPDRYNIIVNIQADEPFISTSNIDYAIEKHLSNNTNDIFYTTLHEENNTIEYLNSTASLKVVLSNNNNVLYYSRNIIPWNKGNQLHKDYIYKTFTGIYVFNRDKLALFKDMKNTDLQLHEDCEQLKILENGYVIKSFPTIDYNEISLNTIDDYKFLLNKYK